jgi:hypothetical protein
VQQVTGVRQGERWEKRRATAGTRVALGGRRRNLRAAAQTAR